MEAPVSTPYTWNMGSETLLLTFCVYSEEEDPDEYPFPLTLRTKPPGPASPLDGIQINGN